MYLKEIKANGFKSFADKIDIQLSTKINAIVGPNGSGKSNIVDAVRWVLGEQSIKSLRGNNLADIIFAGSKDRKPLNSASVTLIFDNSDNHLPLNFNEISVKRIIYRSGESEYYLNNERCRLKDINDVFMDSGIGKESFNIISQGKIDEILSTKPEDRRAIFEEAAKVVKYKKRKEEAIHKLDKTNLNLNRINDIISELENNIEPLKIESEKALKYLELKENLKNIEVALLAYDISKLNNDKLEKSKEITTLNDEIIELDTNNSTLEVNILENKNKVKLSQEKIYEMQNELLNITRKKEQIDADIRLLEERSKYKDNSLIGDNITKLKENILKLNTSINKEKTLGELTDTKLTNITNKLSIVNKELKENIKKKAKLEEELNKQKKDLTDISYKIDYLEDKLTSMDSIPKAVKVVLNNPKFKNVHNILGNLIETEDKYSLALTTALSSTVFNLIVDTKEEAKHIINYLKENNLGRITFYPLDTIKGKTIPEEVYSKIKEEEGLIGIMSSLVKCDNKYKEVVSNLLGTVLLTSNIDVATRISTKINNKCKIVTIDGQQINIGGSLTGGSNIKTISPLSLKKDLNDFLSKKSIYTTEINRLEEKVKEINILEKKLEEEIRENRLEEINLTDIINASHEKQNTLQNEKTNLEKELKDLEVITTSKKDDEKTNLLNTYYDLENKIIEINKNLEVQKLSKENTDSYIKELEENLNKNQSIVSKRQKLLQELNIKVNRTEVNIDNKLLELTNTYNITYESAINNFELKTEEDKARTLVEEYKKQLNSLGFLNLKAPEEYEKLKERYDFLTTQKEDLISAEDTLLKLIKETDSIMEEKFVDTFEKIKIEFDKIFKELFKGGKATLSLTDKDDILNTGIEIFAEPPGKKLQSISLLSGGEKTFTAISLLFAILNVRPVPFCLLDEIEAALDEANVNSFGTYLKKYENKTQFILITHKKKTMEFADTLYGITMKEAGVSKLVSVKLEELK